MHWFSLWKYRFCSSTVVWSTSDWTRPAGFCLAYPNEDFKYVCTFCGSLLKASDPSESGEFCASGAPSPPVLDASDQLFLYCARRVASCMSFPVR